MRLLVLYVIGVVLLSSIDVAYEWLSPLKDREAATPTEWYSVVGLRSGVMMLANREPPGPAKGLSLDVHGPAFFPFPFYAGAGPEGGGIFLTVWFIGLSCGQLIRCCVWHGGVAGRRSAVPVRFQAVPHTERG
jgi:hypothetical protein